MNFPFSAVEPDDKVSGRIENRAGALQEAASLYAKLVENLAPVEPIERRLRLWLWFGACVFYGVTLLEQTDQTPGAFDLGRKGASILAKFAQRAESAHYNFTIHSSSVPLPSKKPCEHDRHCPATLARIDAISAAVVSFSFAPSIQMTRLMMLKYI
jgi:hypothetical protein